MSKRPFTMNYKTYDPKVEGYGHSGQWSESFYERISDEAAFKIIGEQKETPYGILGVSESSTWDEIKAAFRSLINEWHPDKNSHRIEESEVMSKKIIAAYTVLKKKMSK